MFTVVLILQPELVDRSAAPLTAGPDCGGWWQVSVCANIKLDKAEVTLMHSCVCLVSLSDGENKNIWTTRRRMWGRKRQLVMGRAMKPKNLTPSETTECVQPTMRIVAFWMWIAVTPLAFNTHIHCLLSHLVMWCSLVWQQTPEATWLLYILLLACTLHAPQQNKTFVHAE